MNSSPSRLRVWLGGALAAFINGFLEGAPIGMPAGGGAALVDGKIPADTHSLSAIAVAALHVIAIPVLSGLSDVRTWQKSNPFPNIFVPETPPPQSPTP